MNDVYQISPASDGRGGLARLKTLVDGMKKDSPGAMFTLSGDFLSPSLMSSVFKGKQMVDLLNLAGLDYASMGNHEFDMGTQALDDRIKESKFTWINSNVYKTGELYPGTVSHAIFEKDGIKVGVFAVLTAKTTFLSLPATEVEITDPIVSAAESVEELKGLGAKVIVAMTHLDLKDDILLAQSVEGIDLILGGHDHDIVSERVNGVLIVKAGADARSAAKVEINYDTTIGRRSGSEVTFIAVETTLREDATVAGAAASYEKELDEKMAKVECHAAVELDATTQSNRTGQTNMGALAAGAIRAKMEADIGFINGGAIRADRKYPAGAITKKDLFSIFSFGGLVFKLAVSGKAILDALEWGVEAMPEPAGKFPQVDGVTFRFDQSARQGGRVTDVKVGGFPLDPEKIYTIAVTDYIAKGGDGYKMHKGAETIIGEQSAPAFLDVVEEYLCKTHAQPATGQ
ncbi:MAG: bifunctional metallophosphatase/5'-nucleotidase [Nitrospinae bacterium]|nr:bifunctional metallophosphatase/5'-nucleotidase [Nitrospinota bacterium]